MDIRTLLTEHLHIEYKETGGKELLILCPNPKHEDRSPSCHINSETGLFHCKSCQFSGNTKRLVRLTLKGEADPLLDKLNLTSATAGPLESILEELRNPVVQFPPKKDLKIFEDLKTQFSNESHFSSELISKKWFYFEGGALIAHYGIKHWVTPDKYYNRMCIPIRDLSGNIVNFIWRAVDPQQKPKYLILPPENCLMEKKAYIFPNFNVFNPIHKPLPYIVLVEGPFDAIYLDSIGIPSIAVMGTNITGEQIQLIHPLTDNVFLLFDNDDSGHDASISNYYKLKRNLSNVNILFPYNEQIQVNKDNNMDIDVKNPWQIQKTIILKNISHYMY